MRGAQAREPFAARRLSWRRRWQLGGWQGAVRRGFPSFHPAKPLCSNTAVSRSKLYRVALIGIRCWLVALARLIATDNHFCYPRGFNWPLFTPVFMAGQRQSLGRGEVPYCRKAHPKTVSQTPRGRSRGFAAFTAIVARAAGPRPRVWTRQTPYNRRLVRDDSMDR